MEQQGDAVSQTRNPRPARIDETTVLVDLLVSVLAEGGARKPAILRALAKVKGYEHRFDDAISRLKDAGRIRLKHRNGGPHYELRPA